MAGFENFCDAHNLGDLDNRQEAVLAQLLPGIAIVPDRYIGGLLRYLLKGVPAGDFLMAVMRNDLRDAVRRCDDPGLAPIRHLVHFLYDHAPALSWGDKAGVDRWLVAGGNLADPQPMELSRAVAEAALS